MASSQRCRSCLWWLPREAVSEVCRRFEPLPQLLRNVTYKDGKPLEQTAVQLAIDTGRKRLGSRGRLVIRPSGTEPVIRVMAEGDDEHLVHEVVGDIVDAVASHAGGLRREAQSPTPTLQSPLSSRECQRQDGCPGPDAR